MAIGKNRFSTMKLLCLSHQLKEGQSLGLEVDGQALFAIRRLGKAYVYRNRCPHRGISLNWQADHFLDDSASLIHCAHHGALFLIESGKCVAGPCEGQSLDAVRCLENADGLFIEPVS